MFVNTVSNKWSEVAEQVVQKVELIIFNIDEITVGIPIDKIDRIINNSLLGEDFNPFKGIEILDLHQRFGITVSNPAAFAIFKGDLGKLYRIPTDTVPTLISVPLDRIRILPSEFCTDNLLSIASHIATISTTDCQLTIFISTNLISLTQVSQQQTIEA
jgi:hypothetical protein